MSHRPAVWRWGEPVEPLSELLHSGGMLAIPTESTYGLGADPRNDAGVSTVYRFKGRPPDKALPVVLADLGQLSLLGGDPNDPELAELAALWPAPLTVVVQIDKPIPASAGAATLAIRIPAHPRLRALLSELGCPLTATSANPSGETPVSEPEVLLSMLAGWPSMIVDDGVLEGAAASTIVRREPSGYRVLRVGALPPEWIRDRVSRPVFSAAAAEIPADDWRDTR